MNVGCHVNATPHVVGKVFVNPDLKTSIYDACTNTHIKPCINCPERPRAYHAFKNFRVFENTNAPFEPTVGDFRLNLINCTNFTDFSTSLQQFDAAIVADDLCAYAAANGLAPFAATIRPTSGGAATITFNVPADCSSIPSTPVDPGVDYTIYINGLNCGLTFSGASLLMFDFRICLLSYDFFTTTSATTFQALGIALCAHITANCNGLKGEDLQINVVDGFGTDTTLVDLNGGCDVTTSTTNFVFGRTYDVKINDTYFTSFTITS